MAKIQETTDYSKFDICGFNRDVKKTKSLEISMKKHGWIDAYPAHVTKVNGRLEIKAGHHRFTVAQRLGIPVKFVVCDDTATIHDLECSTVQWKNQDYVTSYIRMGNPHYIELGEYCNAYGITLGTAASMFHGQAAGSGNVLKFLKTGQFVIKERNHPYMVASLVELMTNLGFKHSSSKLFVYALSRILFVKELDVARLRKKIQAHYQFLKNPSSMISAQDNLEEIYNKQSKARLPLAFLADAVAKARSSIGVYKQSTEVQPVRKTISAQVSIN